MELARVIPELPAAQRDTLRIVTHASNIATYLSEARVDPKRSPDRGLYRPNHARGRRTAGLGTTSRASLQCLLHGRERSRSRGGWTNNNLAQSKVKQVVMRHSAKVYVVADSSKWRSVNFAPIGPFDAVAGWIVDRNREAEIRPYFSGSKCDLIFADLILLRVADDSIAFRSSKPCHPYLPFRAFYLKIAQTIKQFRSPIADFPRLLFDCDILFLKRVSLLHYLGQIEHFAKTVWIATPRNLTSLLTTIERRSSATLDGGRRYTPVREEILIMKNSLEATDEKTH